MYQSLLKNCLNHEFYNNNMANLRPSLFEDGAKELYQIIASMHDKFSRDISTNEMFAYWRSQNPSSTGAWTDEIETLVNNISEAPDLNSEVASDVIENLWLSIYVYSYCYLVISILLIHLRICFRAIFILLFGMTNLAKLLFALALNLIINEIKICNVK